MELINISVAAIFAGFYGYAMSGYWWLALPLALFGGWLQWKVYRSRKQAGSTEPPQ